MKITNVSNDLNFKGLRINVDVKLLKSKNLTKQLASIKTIFEKNGFSNKKNVNVILSYDSFKKSFVGIIESKKYGVPNNPAYRQVISTKQKVVEAFKNWLNDWDNAYSPNRLKKLRELQQNVIKEVKFPKNK